MSNVPSIFAAPGGSSNNSNNNANSSSTYTPSAAAGGYTPSAAASGSSYAPPTSGYGGYTPSAAAMGTSTSTTATGGYVPSAAAMGTSTYSTTTTSTGGYVPSAAASASTYVPSAAASASTYVPSAAASAGALSVSPPAHATTATRAPAPAPAYNPATTYQKPDQSYASASNAATPYVANATPIQTSYQHGNGPTNGVVTQVHTPVKCHKIDYEIKGSEMQLVEIHLDPEETVIAEAGAMMYLEDDVDFKTKFGDGSEPKQGFFKKLMAAGGRLMTGESLFITHFTNRVK